MAPLTAKAAPVFTVQVWLAARPTGAEIVCVGVPELGVFTVMPLPPAASIVSIFVPPMVTALVAATSKVRLLMSKSEPFSVVVRFPAAGVVV